MPAGFEFDLSTIPRIFWPLIGPFELSIVAPLLHDFLYTHGGKPPAGSVGAAANPTTRAEVDRMFREIMASGRPGLAACARVRSPVRLFGRPAPGAAGPPSHPCAVPPRAGAGLDGFSAGSSRWIAFVSEKVIYFPRISPPDNEWFTRVLLFWDEVGTIVPMNG